MSNDFLELNRNETEVLIISPHTKLLLTDFPFQSIFSLKELLMKPD